MAALFLIIDGYNLLHAAGLARARYAPGDLQRQRHRLLVQLGSEMSAEERIRCTVVFDALEAPSGLDRQFRHGEMTVMFADPGHEADELIEALIASHTAPRQLLVVSSDHRLQKAAIQRRADSIDSEAFLERQSASAKARRLQSGNSGDTVSTDTHSQSDLDFWLNEFGDIDVQSLEYLDLPEDDASSIEPWQRDLEDLQRRMNSAEDLDDWLNRPPGSDSPKKPD